MNTASLENSKRLFELSGWKDTSLCWGNRKGHRPAWINTDWSDANFAELKKLTLAYDASYLLRKLPKGTNLVKEQLTDHFNVACPNLFGKMDYRLSADTPEDALCLLAIKLFEEGVLKK